MNGIFSLHPLLYSSITLPYAGLNVYKLYRRIFNKTVAQYPPIGLKNSANDKVEAFADTFQDQFFPNFGTALPEVTKTVNQISNARITSRWHNTRNSRAIHQTPS